jgi:hypothetical protein
MERRSENVNLLPPALLSLRRLLSDSDAMSNKSEKGGVSSLANNSTAQ